MRNPIASRRIHSITRDGEPKPLHISIGLPYQVSNEEWACPIAIEGLHDNLRDIHGIDSFQALTLAIKLIARLLQQFIDQGGKLYWPDVDVELTVQDLLSGLAIPQPSTSLDPESPHQ